MKDKYFPVNQLRERYSIGKQADINRRKHLGIKPVKVNGSFQITNQELELLDALDEYLKTPGAKMASFNPTMLETANKGEQTALATEYEPMNAEIVPPQREQPTIPGLLESSPDTLKYLIKDILVDTVSELNLVNPIHHWERLHIAVEQRFWLSTKEVKKLVGTTPSTRKGETTWQRGCFLFTKVGKIGNQTAWKVTRIEE